MPLTGIREMDLTIAGAVRVAMRPPNMLRRDRVMGVLGGVASGLGGMVPYRRGGRILQATILRWIDRVLRVEIAIGQ